MADLADQIDDYICSFEGVGDLTMDTLAMLIFAWAVIALFVLWLCKFLYNKYVKKKTDVTGSVPGGSSLSADAALKAKLLGSSVVGGGIGPDDKLRKSEPKDILASSREIKEVSVKPLGKGVTKSAPRTGGGAGGGGGGGGYVPPTPPIRKRLSRKSPGPELRRSRIIQPPANVVGPETVSVTWCSQVFRWLYSDLVIVNELLATWVQALNDFTKKSVEEISSVGNNHEQQSIEHGVAVEIVRVLPESPPPQLSNIFCNAAENNPNDVTITMDCECTPVLQVKAFRQKSGKVETSHYKGTISRFRGRLSVKMDYYKLRGEMKTEGYPDIRITLNSIGPIKGTTQDETQLQEVVSEILTNALRGTVYPVDFSVYSTCPRAVEFEPPEVPINYPIHYDSLATNMEQLNAAHIQSTQNNGGIISSGRRLLVKIIKGEGLAQASDPYCVVEMDEPPQKNQTGARQGKSPCWDEHFLFDLSPQSAEILFEVYDRTYTNQDGTPKFLGLGLVGIEELSVGPASSQILTLQPRPYETDAVNGAIMVEFVFIDGAEIPAGRRPYKLKNALKINAHSPTFNESMQNGTDVVDKAIRAIEGGALTTTQQGQQPSKSTLIIHSVQRQPSYRAPYKVSLNPQGQIELNETVPLDNSEDFSPSAETPNSSFAAEMPGGPMAQSSPYHTNGFHNRDNEQFGTSSVSPVTPTTPTSPIDSTHMGEEDRGRTKRKRDFFGTLKRRLGRSKSRAKSADRDQMTPIDPDNPRGEIRSISADRGGTLGSPTRGAGGVGGSGRFINNTSSTGPTRLYVPTLDQSRRSSLSESSAISGLSTASNKTFVHEASTLVLETVENGVKRHFLVPLAIAQRPRWRRKGTKLHIYNDHTFVAKHLSGGLLCDVCNRSIPRRPGKQGYECRDCLAKCHKQCHVRSPQACTNPTVLSIQLSTLPQLTENHI